ncbi:MAG: glycosyltransferase [Lachnospiraceae bacterium]|nr:glycosyltransferase [Lachnospiraceae bacterium]
MSVYDKMKESASKYGGVYAFDKIKGRFLVKYIDGKKYFPCDITADERKREEGFDFENEPLISVLVPVYNTDSEMFEEMLDSLMNQTYKNYEIVLADASDEDKKMDYLEYLRERFTEESNEKKEDSEESKIESEIESEKGDKLRVFGKIKYLKLDENLGISENTNAAFKASLGEYISLMDHDDILHPSALFEVVKVINKKNADFIYTDELSFDKTTDRVQSIHFKPQFSLENLKNNNYICHFTTFKRELFTEVKGFRKEYDGSQDYDLFLRMTDIAECIFHIPKVLYYWRLSQGSVATDISAKDYALTAAENALKDYLNSKGIKGEVSNVARGAFFNVRHEISDDTKLLVITEDKESEIMLNNSLESIKKISTVICAEPNDKLLYERIKDTEESIIIFVRKGIDEKENSLILNDSEWAIRLMEALVPRNVGAASPQVKNDKEYLFAGYAYKNIKNHNLISLHEGRKINDPGYMNKLLSRQSVSLLGGMMLAVKKNYLVKILQRHEEFKKSLTLKDAFDGIFWLYVSYMISKNGKECIVDPFSAVVMNKGYKNKELNALKKYKKLKASDSYHKRHCYVRMKKAFRYTDPMYNLNFRTFGKYYKM